MKKVLFLLLALSTLFLTACDESTTDLPATDYVMIKFVNKTGMDIEDMTVSRVNVNALKNGGSSEYLEYDALGQQYGYALVENVAVLDGKRYYTASACQGVCGTPSAPHGQWLTPGYYKISVHVSDELGGDYLTFRMMD